MKLLDLLKGETLSARNALDDLSASIGEERILWYPSAGRDYRDILETMPERLPMHGIYGPGPNLFCHTDYKPFWGIEKDFTETLFSDANTWITILERHPVAFREEAGVRYGVDPDHAVFSDHALPAPRIELMKIRAVSRQLGQATVPLLYFFFENHNFMHEVVLKHRLRIPWFVKVREGCGFGGCRKCISPFYTRLGDTGTEYMLVDEEKKEYPGLSMQRQCDLLSIHRSGLYYQPKKTSKLNLELMRLLDEQYLKKPYYGVYRMWKWLVKDKGYDINIKLVRRLCRLKGLEAIGPKPNTSKPAPGLKVYPYLLRGLHIERCNQVWATDITYIPMAQGFMYLMAVIDLKSRYVLNWSVSNTMDAEWCAEVFREAVRIHGAPEILNTDQGSQFTSEVFTTAVIKEAKAKLSMDGKGRAIDNVFIERLWRSVKHEYIYSNPCTDGLELYLDLKDWFTDYNTDRRHKALKGEVPATAYDAQAQEAA